MSKETALQTLGEILDRLNSCSELHIDDVGLGMLFGFSCGVTDPAFLLKYNAEAIQRANAFAEEHGCGFLFAAEMAPPKGIFLTAWGGNLLRERREENETTS
jgi:hypothetical protein